jgi:hypothetical protein
MQPTVHTAPKHAETLAQMRARLDGLASRIHDLKSRQEREGGALAGKLVTMLEIEQAEIQAGLQGRRPGA